METMAPQMYVFLHKDPYNTITSFQMLLNQIRLWELMPTAGAYLGNSPQSDYDTPSPKIKKKEQSKVR